MRALVHVFLVGALALMASGLGGCSGGLGEGGDNNVGPQPPPNFNHPIYQGRLSGRVVFDAGFLHHGLMSAGSSGKTTGAVLDRDRAFYKSLTVRAIGPKGRKRVKVLEDGSFDFDTIRRGDYLLEISGSKGLLAATPISLDGKSKMEVTLRLLGHDLADLDGDSDRRELVVEREIVYRSDAVNFRRVFPPAGDVRTYLDDGSMEVLGPDGYAKVFGADGTIEYRFDPSNRFVDEESETETGQRPRKKANDRKLPKDPLAAKISGVNKAPLVLGVSVVGLSSSRDVGQLKPGDLARLEVKTDANGGTDVAEVTATVYGPKGRPQRLALLDDGGQGDRRPQWPGKQASLDRQPGDGVYTFPIVLDSPTYRFLSECQIVVSARNVKQKVARPASMHLYLSAPPAEMVEAGSVAKTVAGVRVVEDPPGSNQFRAEVALKEPLPDGTSALLLGPSSFRRLLTPSAEGRLSSTTAALEERGMYTVLLTDPDGDLFYASFRRRTDDPRAPAARKIEADEPPEPAPRGGTATDQEETE